MKYFNHIDTFEKLKAEYHHLIFKNHPDHGGNTETMQEINAEFNSAFHIIKKQHIVNSAQMMDDPDRVINLGATNGIWLPLSEAYRWLAK